jgi:hypothetical protein
VVDGLVELGRGLHVQSQVTLSVEIDEENPLSDLGKCGAKVDGSGGLANTTLLHGDGYRSGQECPESNRS